MADTMALSVKSPTTPVSAAHVCAQAGPSTREQGPTSGQTLHKKNSSPSPATTNCQQLHHSGECPRPSAQNSVSLGFMQALYSQPDFFFFLIHGQSRDYEYSGLEFDLIQQQTLVFVWFSLGF